jgi:hypothetical protein
MALLQVRPSRLGVLLPPNECAITVSGAVKDFVV